MIVQFTNCTIFRLFCERNGFELCRARWRERERERWYQSDNKWIVGVSVYARSPTHKIQPHRATLQIHFYAYSSKLNKSSLIDELLVQLVHCALCSNRATMQIEYLEICTWMWCCCHRLYLHCVSQHSQKVGGDYFQSCSNFNACEG